MPPRIEVVIYFLLSAFTFVFINVAPIINRVSSEPLPKSLSSEDYLGSLGFLSDMPFVNTAVIVIFWSGVGLVAYTVAWALINAVIEARNEIVVESEYLNKGRFWDRYRQPLLKSALVLILFAWVVLNAKWLLPELLKDFRGTLVTGSGTELLRLLLPYAALTANLALAMILFRAVRHVPEIDEAITRKPSA